MNFKLKNFFLVIIFLVITSPAMSEQHEKKPSWNKICESVGDNLICQTSFGQYMDVGGQNIWYSRVGIVELNGVQKKLFIHAPLGVKLQNGIIYQIDDFELSSMQYAACYNVQGCQGLVEVNDSIIDQMKKGSAIKMRFTSINGKPIDGSVSLIGFTSAYTK